MPEETMKRTVAFSDQELTYILEQKQVKNLNLRIRKDGSVYVSANPMVPAHEVDDFVIRKSEYITRAVNQFHLMQQYQPEPKRYVSGETFYLEPETQ